jgi:alpha-galactosidase/6-phospho-beta-glucosidase family protein
MLHMAHFLYTKAEPRLYYKPWEMSPEEEDRVEEQIAEARDVIQRERDEFEAREEEERRRERRATPDATTYRGTDVVMTGDGDAAQPQAGSKEATNEQEPHTQDHEMQDQQPEEPAVEPQPADDPVAVTQPPEPETAADEPSKDADEEEVVEAAEDTVIY